MLRHSCRWGLVTAAVPLLAGLAVPGLAQTGSQAPGDLPVTRLQGGGGEAAVPPRLPQPRPADLSMLPVTQLADRAGADLDGPRRIALSLARPMPLKDMLLLLVSGTPFSLVADDTVEGAFTGDLKDLTMRQALEAVLFPRGLDYDVEGSLIRVSAHKPETRIFTVDFVDQRRSWTRTTRGSGADGPDASVTSAGGTDRFADLTAGVRSLLSETGRLHIDRSAGLVQVTDFTERVERVGVYLEAVQARALRQVRIEARVFEVTLKDAAAIGVDWRAAGARARVAGDPTRPSGMTAGDAASLMRAVAEQGTVTMIASPQIVAMNNETALMRVGTRAAYFEADAPAGAGGRAPSPVHRTLLEGLTLIVTAQLAGDGAVQLSVAPSYSEKSGEVKSEAGSYPLMRVSEADTVLRVQDGDTVVLAGFLRDRASTRPGVGLAKYFGAESHETVKAELVILLTPTVLPPGTGTAAARR